ncbi:glycosyltransferase [Streptomyces sp. NPDC050485]|uniref:glycosyltransferase family 4 protein n=1 Tax=Streptomyces sp. NPDC050485 TaxID=3365617 RepID=UPI0037B55D66
MPPSSVHFIVPATIHDPQRPSGGNTYDLNLARNLPYMGWEVHLHPLAGSWPWPGAGAQRAVVLLDGLLACIPDIVEAVAPRLCLAVLVHMPLADERGLSAAGAADLDAREARVLRCASVIIAPSAHTARQLVAHHALRPAHVHTAHPGVGIVPRAPGTDGVSQLLCVASLTPVKGHQVLIDALATATELPWHLRLVGGVQQNPGHVRLLRDLINARGLVDRIVIDGPKSGADLDAAYAAADLLVLPSFSETYGLVVTEALARGIPVMASQVGGVPEALGCVRGGQRPGLLPPPGSVSAWSQDLRSWLTDAELRDRLRKAARTRSQALPYWHTTARPWPTLSPRSAHHSPRPQPEGTRRASTALSPPRGHGSPCYRYRRGLPRAPEIRETATPPKPDSSRSPWTTRRRERTVPVRFRLFHLKNRPSATTTADVPLPACMLPECDALQALPDLYSPLIAELMAIYCHTRPLGALSQKERCVNEFQMTARSIINHLLEGWATQTDGQGTIDDLLLAPRNSRTTAAPSARSPEVPSVEERRLAS